MSQDWTEKYRPKTLSGVIGNPKAVGELKAWAESWNSGIPKKRAVVLLGTPGIGKTTSAEALAADMGWGIVEMNASDQRTGGAIRMTALRGALSDTFDDTGNFLKVSDGGRKLIVLDEADNLFGNADRGALPAIAELIKNTKQPVILIVNDFYALSKKSSVIKNDTIQLSFQRPPVVSIVKALKNIASKENLSVTDEALKRIAENSNGDMRAAVRDLESLAMGRMELSVNDIVDLSDRIVKKDIYDLMVSVFRKSDAMGSRTMIRDINEELSYVLLWLDENMPYEYKDKGDLVRGYEKLSRADIFLSRVGRRNFFGLWSYASDTMTAGVATARMSSIKNYGRIMFPGYLMKMSRSKGMRELKGSVCSKLSVYMHTSTGRISKDVLPLMRVMVQNDPELRITLVRDAHFDAEELAFLMNVKIDSKEVKAAFAAVEDTVSTKKVGAEIVVNEISKPAVKQIHNAQRTLF